MLVLFLFACDASSDIRLGEDRVRLGDDTDTGGAADADTDTDADGDTDTDTDTDADADTDDTDTGRPECAAEDLGLFGIPETAVGGATATATGCLGDLETSCDAPATMEVDRDRVDTDDTLGITFGPLALDPDDLNGYRNCSVQGYGVVDGTAEHVSVFVRVYPE